MNNQNNKWDILFYERGYYLISIGRTWLQLYNDLCNANSLVIVMFILICYFDVWRSFGKINFFGAATPPHAFFQKFGATSCSCYLFFS